MHFQHFPYYWDAWAAYCWGKTCGVHLAQKLLLNFPFCFIVRRRHSFSLCFLLPTAQGFPGIHIVRRLIESLEEIPDELATDPGDALPPNIYRVGLYESFR